MSRRLALFGLLLASGLALTAWTEYHRRQGVRRELTRGELEATLRDRFDLEAITLAEGPPGRFTGAGQGVRGRTYEFDITQGGTERRVRAEWRRDKPNEYGEARIWTNYADRFSHLIYLGLAGAITAAVVLRRRVLSLRPHPPIQV